MRANSAAKVSDFIASVLPLATRVGTAGDVTTYRWQDENGARLVIGLRHHEVVDFVPSFAAAEGLRLADVRPLNDDVAGASVVDDHGETLTTIAFELEQRRALTGRVATPLPAALVAFGRSVEVFTGEAALAASPGGAAESFTSNDAAADPAVAEPTARITATVLSARRLTNEQTGRDFIACRVRCTGFEFDVVLDSATHPQVPQSGAVVAGTVFLVASIASLGFGAR